MSDRAELSSKSQGAIARPLWIKYRAQLHILYFHLCIIFFLSLSLSPSLRHTFPSRTGGAEPEALSRVYIVFRRAGVNTGFLLASFKASPTRRSEYTEDNRQRWSSPLSRMGTRTAALPISTYAPIPPDQILRCNPAVPIPITIAALLSLLSLTALLLLKIPFLALGSSKLKARHNLKFEFEGKLKKVTIFFFFYFKPLYTIVF